MKTFVLFILSISLFGCADHTYQYYRFESDKISTKYGESGAIISGEYVKVSEDPKVTHFGNPYRLLITFNTDEKSQSPRAVDNVIIRSAAGEVLYSLAGGEMETTWSDYSRNWFSAWRHAGLQLSHESFTLEFELIFMMDGEEIKQSLVKEFVPAYEEEESNDFIDGIMSV